jgi:hypothetical protein
VGLSSLVIGVVLATFGPELRGPAAAFWDGLLQGASVAFMAGGIFLSASGAAALAGQSIIIGL